MNQQAACQHWHWLLFAVDSAPKSAIPAHTDQGNCKHRGRVACRGGYRPSKPVRVADFTYVWTAEGGAWSDTNYSINGNTSVGGATLGVGSVTASAVGWTLGGGQEYALNSKWSGKVEYDYIDFGGKGLTFATVAVIGAAPVSVQQNINVMKVGVDYKLN